MRSGLEEGTKPLITEPVGLIKQLGTDGSLEARAQEDPGWAILSPPVLPHLWLMGKSDALNSSNGIVTNGEIPATI
jgi:hypothetical protein